MTIKTKLTLNIVLVLTIVAAVVTTSIFGMRFISGKLAYLTQKSTPYQMRTLEFQREIQGATANLAKVSTALNPNELQAFRKEADQALSEVQKAQQHLESLNGGARLGTHEELQTVAGELYSIVDSKIQAQQEAEKASDGLSKRMNESTARLRELDSKIRSLQGNRTGAFSAALDESGRITGRLRGVEAARLQLKDLQLGFYEVQNAQKRPTLLIARGKVNAAVSKLQQNEHIKTTKGAAADIKWLADKLDELQKLQGNWLSQKDDDTKAKADAAVREINEKLSAVFLSVEQDALQASERYATESAKQGSMFGQSNQANAVLVANSELVSLGMDIEASALALFTLKSSAEIDKSAPLIKNKFAKAAQTAQNLEKNLIKLGVKDELRILKSATGALAGILNSLFAENGIVATLKKRFEMEQKAQQAAHKLRELVIKQAAKGKETVTAAQGEQEKAIASVNKVVKTSISLLIAISIAAAVIGIVIGAWVFRSVSAPLGQLVTVSNQVAGGDLHEVQLRATKDEFGKVLASMGTMVANLRDMVGRITATTRSIADSSCDLAGTANGLEDCSHNQSKQIDQSVTAMTEMTQTIQDVSRNALSTADAAGRMKSLAMQGQGALDRTSQELFSFTEVVRESVQRVEALGQRSDAINAIVDIIKDIADQTNLLALNASIEAARAGDMGRGFAVVADSVRQLAHRTTESADEIASTVKGMQTEVNASVITMQRERQAIEGIVTHLEETQHAMSEIVSNVEHVFEMVQTIATATEEQSATAEEVNRSMQAIHTVTGELIRSVDRINNAANGFANLARELQQMVGWFKV